MLKLFRDAKYSVETLLAMILWNAKEQAEAYAKDKIKQLIITVPSYFDENERTGIAYAVNMTGLKLLKVRIILKSKYF